MFGSKGGHDARAKVEAIEKSQAVIEFSMDATIISANANFLAAVGYSLPEIVGRPHSMFVDQETRESSAYRDFWASLRRGEFQAAEYKRIGKGGREIWIQATYNPIFNRAGKPIGVIKFATDVTSQKLQAADYAGQISAISRSQAVIQFTMDGTIVDANDNFLGAVGYARGEIVGKHHSMFVEPAARHGAEYTQFWAALRRGEFQAAEYKRIGKGGREIWIQATYNPIFDLDGKPIKVVKFAADVTKAVQNRLKNEIIQREMTGNLTKIVTAISNTSAQSTSAASASVQTSSNVQAAAAGAEQFDVSVNQIAESMSKSRKATDDAVSRVTAADLATERLTSSAQAMSGIVNLIQGIAEQINLLALNATIEAARAGDAGRGFAVVATEVKNLANQAKGATEQISKEIGGLQSVSAEVAGSLSGIKGAIDALRAFVNGAASAVQEQSSVAREMSSNMQSAAKAVTSISSNLSEIAKAADIANTSARQVQEAARALAA